MLPESNNPARLLYNYLVPWFEGPASSGLRYIDIPFDMSEPVHATRYRNKWEKDIAALGTCVSRSVAVKYLC